MLKKAIKLKLSLEKTRTKKESLLETLPKKDKVIVEGVNIVKKHQKPSQAAPQGGNRRDGAPIHVSNVMVIDPSTGEANSRRL